MRKSPLLPKSSNLTSQSVPNKKPQTPSNAVQTLNYLQIIKQYNSCKLLKPETNKIPSNNPVSPAFTQQTLRTKLNLCAKTAKTPNILTENAKFPAKYAVKVPADAHLRASNSKSKEQEENKENCDRDNAYLFENRQVLKKVAKIPSNGSQTREKPEKLPLSPREAAKTCFFHPDKRAKYMKHRDENLAESNENVTFFCSKCAIELALKGIRVYDIEENREFSQNSGRNARTFEENSKRSSLHSFEASASPANTEKKLDFRENSPEAAEFSKRQREINEFLAKLRGVKKVASSSTKELEERKAEISGFYDREITRIDEFFRRVQLVLQTNKRVFVDKLQKFREETEASLRNELRNSEFSAKEIDKIELDITENVENILKNMEDAPFRAILAKYDAKLATFQKNFEEIAKEPLILNKIRISFRNYRDSEPDLAKFHEEVWNLVRPYVSFSRIPALCTEEIRETRENSNENVAKNQEIFVSFENKEFFEEKSLNREKSREFCSVETVCSPNSKKYLDLLNKINNNQENNNIFYCNALKKDDKAEKIEKNLLFSPHFREKLEN